MLELMSKKSYKQAMDIADVIDWRKVKNVAMLCAVSEIYEYNKEYQKSRDILFLAYDRAPESRKIIYRLGTLALKLKEVKEAEDCLEEFVALAPKDPNQFILKYKILKEKNAPVAEQIDVLETFKKIEYVEKWAYELAVLYQKAGMTAECLEECDDLVLWFSEGKYVYKALQLKMQYKPLSPLQQEKYNQCQQDSPISILGQEPVAEAPVVEEPVAEESAVEEPVAEAPVVEEPVAEEPAVEEPVVEEPVVEEPAVEEIVIEEPVVEEKKAAPTLSIEEMLLEWEEKQKENAQMIRTEIEKVEAEKAEAEKEKESVEVVEEEENLLSDDIRQLMEELETESADIQAAKIQPQEVPVAEEKSLVQKVAEQLVALDIKEAPAAKVTETPVVEKVQEVPVEPVTPVVPVVPTAPAAPVIPASVVEKPVAKAVESIMNTKKFEPIEEIEEISEGIKLGDTQSMAAVAKALKNNVEIDIPEEKPEPVKEKSPYDTGFIVQGRYDLDAQSAIGLKAGLTEEQKKLFSYFVPVRGMSEQLVEVLQKDKKCKSRYGTSRIGNILVIGRKGSGKTVLAVDVVKAIQKARKLKQGKVGIVTADSLNKKDVTEILEKLHGGAIIIEKASRLNRRTIEDMCEVMEGQTREMLVVLEDERKPIEKLFAAYPQFAKKFTSRVEVPVFINDELVTFGQTYAKENGYKIDEMGILALYTRIDMLQREEKIVTVAHVKDIVDEAIENSQGGGFKKLIKKLTGKNKDESDRILLHEEDFK